MPVPPSGGAMALSAISTGLSSAKNSVHHEHPAIDAVCVEYDPTTPDAETVPAWQQELKAHAIDSRVFDTDVLPASCAYSVTYVADIEWEVPPGEAGYRPYLRDATVTLRNHNGDVLASSAYEPEGAFQMGKWATRRSKLAPVVAQLVTGFDH